VVITVSLNPIFDQLICISKIGVKKNFFEVLINRTRTNAYVRVIISQKMPHELDNFFSASYRPKISKILSTQRKKKRRHFIKINNYLKIIDNFFNSIQRVHLLFLLYFM